MKTMPGLLKLAVSYLENKSAFFWKHSKILFWVTVSLHNILEIENIQSNELYFIITITSCVAKPLVLTLCDLGNVLTFNFFQHGYFHIMFFMDL